MMTIHFKAQLRPIVGKHLGMLNWVMDPAVSGFIIGYDLDEDQVLICNFDSKQTPTHLWTKEHALKTIVSDDGGAREAPEDRPCARNLLCLRQPLRGRQLAQ